MQVNAHYKIPLRAILLNALVAMLLNLINIASSTAFSAVLSLTTISLYCSYMLPIAILVLWRVRKDQLNLGPFTLGQFGLVINVIGLLWGVFTVVFVVFPTEIPVTAANMKYASLVFGSALLSIFLAWFLHGRKVFQGPINELVEGREAFT